MIRTDYGDWFKTGIEFEPTEYPQITSSDKVIGNEIIESPNTRDGAIAYLFMGKNYFRIETIAQAPALGLIGYSDTHTTATYIRTDYGDWIKTGQAISPGEYYGLESVAGLSVTAGGFTINTVANNARDEVAFMFVGVSAAQDIADFSNDNVPDVGFVAFAVDNSDILPTTYGDWIKTGQIVFPSIYPALQDAAGITNNVIDFVLNSGAGGTAYMFAGNNIKDIRSYVIAPVAGTIAYAFVADDSVLGIATDYGDWIRTDRTVSASEYTGLDPSVNLTLTGVTLGSNGDVTINYVGDNAYDQVAFMYAGDSSVLLLENAVVETLDPAVGTIAFAESTDILISLEYGDWIKTGTTILPTEYPQLSGVTGVAGNVITPVLASGSGRIAYMFAGKNVLLIDNIATAPAIGSVSYSNSDLDTISNSIGTWFKAGKEILEAQYNRLNVYGVVEEVSGDLIKPMTSNNAPSPQIAGAYNSYQEPYLAFDYNESTKTYWQSGDSVGNDRGYYDTWLSIDLGASKLATGYTLVEYNNISSYNYPIEWMLQGSNTTSTSDYNSKTWTNLHEVTASGGGTNWAAGVPRTFQIPEEVQNGTTGYRYYRLYIYRVGYGWEYCYISDFQLHTKAGYKIKNIANDTLGNTAYIFIGG
jgi:hypothetical protein